MARGVAYRYLLRDSLTGDGTPQEITRTEAYEFLRLGGLSIWEAEDNADLHARNPGLGENVYTPFSSKIRLTVERIPKPH